MSERERKKARLRGRITFRKKKHPEPPLSHILAYPMVANMAGSGVQERVRVSVRRVKGARAPSPGGYRVAASAFASLRAAPHRVSSMSEYRPGRRDVTSHPSPSPSLRLPRFASGFAQLPPTPSFSLFCHLVSLRALYGPLRPSTALSTLPPRNIPLNVTSLLRFLSTCPHSISLCRARHFFPPRSLLSLPCSFLSFLAPCFRPFRLTLLMPLPDFRTCIPALFVLSP